MLWWRQGIGHWSDFNFELTEELRDWMEANLGQRHGGDLWWWEHFEEEGEVFMMFKDPTHATLFKLTWL